MSELNADSDMGSENTANGVMGSKDVNLGEGTSYKNEDVSAINLGPEKEEYEEDGDNDDDDFENEMEDSTEGAEAGTGEDAKSDGVNRDEKPEGLLGYKYKRVLKKHQAPVHSIPCLHYLRNKEKLMKWEKPDDVATKEENRETDPTKESDDKESSKEVINDDSEKKKENQDVPGDSVTQMKVILHEKKDQCLTDDELKGYLERRFEFETLEIPQFQKWSQRRNFNRNLRRKKLEEESGSTSNAQENGDDKKNGAAGPSKLITLTVEQDDGPGGTSRNRKFVLNTNGKPMICILHEYAQRVLRVQPKYVFNIREDSAEPFEATIKMNEKEYGTAFAINKKTAKNKAALATLEMLIPGFKGQVESATEPPDMAYFDKVNVTDTRVYELCIHTGQMLPYQLLTECLKRNQGITDTTVSYDVQQGKRKSLNYTMKCGKHVVNGVAKNKKIGKQMAAQQILGLLHPNVKTWSELIEMYGISLAQERANRKQAEQEIFDLKQRRNIEDDRPSTSKQTSKKDDQISLEPNPELLAKLREMMTKLEEKRIKKRKISEEEENSGAKRKKLTPMEAALAAGKGLLSFPVDVNLGNDMECS